MDVDDLRKHAHYTGGYDEVSYVSRYTCCNGVIILEVLLLSGPESLFQENPPSVFLNKFLPILCAPLPSYLRFDSGSHNLIHEGPFLWKLEPFLDIFYIDSVQFVFPLVILIDGCLNMAESSCHRNVLGGRTEIGVEIATKVFEVSTLVPWNRNTRFSPHIVLALPPWNNRIGGRMSSESDPGLLLIPCPYNWIKPDICTYVPGHLINLVVSSGV